ncbi:Hypothetical protein GbCGDNIH9_1368 [Granulibacter bethesdensis]|uniref:Stress induced hydrophobic peptide n=2 Tax=Granulibacter bethesdensis TaxID=364410 RepID=A0AAC9K9U4_9PROT|nr:Hypothetical protein GbCGDNIH9_1368 [Granulibacter bethesdensis]APH62257.1 Hypothetical protein GbCGDNIH8_1368 [Granulibacter bethesdensis]
MIACVFRNDGKSRSGDRGGFFRLSSHPYSGDRTMRLLIALILPWLTFFTIGRPISGVVCLILQVTLIGWLPATIWAVYALSQYKTDQKIEQAFGRRP